MSELITIEQFQRVLPKQVKAKVSPTMVDNLNGLLEDQDLRQNFRDNLLSYTSVMNDGRFKIKDYINAVRYVSYKMLGSSNIEAYTKTFPDRFQRLVDEGADERTISSYCAAYNKTQLVNKILEQTLIPSHIFNADIYQKAINTQASLMVDEDVSPKVRSDAANSLLTHLKAPESHKLEIDIDVKSDTVIQDLRKATTALVQQQKDMLLAGTMRPIDVAHSQIIEGEVTDVDE